MFSTPFVTKDFHLTRNNQCRICQCRIKKMSLVLVISKLVRITLQHNLVFPN